MDLNNSEKPVFDNFCQINIIYVEFKYYYFEEKIMMHILTKALKNRFNMKNDDAVSLTKTIENIFKGQKEIEDMTIDKYARALLYELQREKILRLRREEFKEKGKIIRKFYWSFDHKAIEKVAKFKKIDEPYEIYKKIPKNAWAISSKFN